MTLRRRQFLHLAVGAVTCSPFSESALAQTYPSRPVKIIVGQAAGSASDIVARLITPDALLHALIAGSKKILRLGAPVRSIDFATADGPAGATLQDYPLAYLVPTGEPAPKHELHRGRCSVRQDGKLSMI